MKNGTELVEFIAGQGWLQNPDEVGEKNWSRALQITLAFGNIPYQFTLSQNAKKTVLASVASVCGLFNQGAENMSHP